MASKLSMEAMGFSMPQVSASGLAGKLLIGLVFILLCAILGAITWWIINQLRYKVVIRIFRQDGQAVKPVATDKGWMQTISPAGDTWLRFKKMKKLTERPSIWMSKKEVWYFLREDGELVNFGLNNFDETMKKAGCKYVSEDMRFARLSIDKILTKNFSKQKWWEKYGTQLAFGLFMLVVVACLIFLFKEMAEIPDKIGGVAESAKITFEASEKAAAATEKMANAVAQIADSLAQHAGKTANLRPVNVSGV